MSVCYLDVQDEITDAVARLRAASDRRVIVVLPPGSRIGTSRINFRLLLREADSRGIALDVVSGEPEVRALALSAGMRSFATVADAERAELPDPMARPLSEAPLSAPPVDPYGPVAARGAGAVRPATPQEPELASGIRRGLPPAGARPGSAPQGSRPGQPPANDPRWARTETGTFAVMPRAASGQGPEGVGDAWTGDAGPQSKARRRGRFRVGRLFGWAIRLAILAAILGGAAYGAYLYLPTATISLTPATQPFGPTTFTITADPNVAVADAVPGKIPAKVVGIPLAETATFDATGQNVVQSKAQGSVTFTSTDTLFDVPVPDGTTLATTSGVQFVTMDPVVLPKAAINQPSSVEVGIRAVVPGSTGNVDAGTVTVVPKSIADLLVTATNPQPTTGGRKTQITSVTKADYDGAIATLTQKLTDDLQVALGDPSNTPAGLTIYPETAALGRVNPSLAAGDLVGSKVDTFDLSVDTQGTVLAVDEGQVATSASKELLAAAPVGVRVFPETVTTQVSPGTVSGSTIAYQVIAQARQYTPVDPGKLQQQVAGKTLSEARSILGAYGHVEVSVWPDFIPTIPNDIRRINLTIQDPTTDIPN